jgi:hypothetical protein
VDSDVHAAIQAAALADHYRLASELAEQHGLSNICLRCTARAPVTQHACDGGEWPICGTCNAALRPGHLVFRPGATTSDGNVHADWPTLIETAQRMHGTKTIVFESPTAEPCVIPPGVWDMRDCIIAGSRPFQPIASEGATFDNPYEVRDLAITGVMIKADRISFGGLLVADCHVKP